MLRFFSGVCAALMAGAMPAAADAVVYSGTLGKLPVILELTAPPEEGPAAARYSYLAKGADIPLKGVAGEARGELRFEEEMPCTEKLCGNGEGGIAEEAPIAADWTLAAEGSRLTGTWRDRKSGRTLPVALVRKATRPIDIETYGALESLDPDYVPVEHEAVFVMEPEFYPYDFLKLDWPTAKGTEQRLGAGVYRLDTDERTGIAYPAVVSLGGADVKPVNAWLRQARLQFELPAFRCGASAYFGFGWSGIEGQGGSGYDGGGTVSVDHLSARLIGLTENGSYWCGGAHPDNFSVHRFADARSGDLVVAERLLAGWQARDEDGKVVDPDEAGDASLTYGPSEDLVAYVRSHRRRFDADTERDCGIDDLLPGNLGVYFRQNSLVFTLNDLPHVIFACTDDLLEVPLKEARPLLTEEGAGYFEQLDR